MNGGPPIRAVVWDWNGTLLDDVAAGLETTNQMLRAHGRAALASHDAYRASFGFPIREFYRRLGFEHDDEFAQAAGDYLTRFPAAVADAPLQEGALEALTGVRALGLRQVLISATVEPVLLRQMAPHGIGDWFDEVLGITDPMQAAKTHIVAGWLERSGLVPGQVLMVGDTNHDEEIAGALGCRFLRFAGGHQEPPAGATVVHRLAEVVDGLRAG